MVVAKDSLRILDHAYFKHIITNTYTIIYGTFQNMQKTPNFQFHFHLFSAIYHFPN